MPQKNPTAGEYILAVLGGALPGYVKGKILRDQEGKQAELDSKQDFSGKLFKIYSDSKLPTAERQEAKNKYFIETGKILPTPTAVPTETEGEKPFDYSGYEKGQADIKYKEAGVSLRKAQEGAYKALAGKRTKDSKDRENALKEMNVQLDNLEFQWKNIPRKVTGAIKEEHVKHARLLESQMKQLSSDISRLRGEKKADEEYKEILEGIRSIQGLGEQ